MYFRIESERIGKKFSKRVMIDGVIYPSLRHAAHALEISRATMSKYCKLGEYKGKKISIIGIDKNYKKNEENIKISGDNIGSKEAPFAREGIFF